MIWQSATTNSVNKALFWSDGHEGRRESGMGKQQRNEEKEKRKKFTEISTQGLTWLTECDIQ